MFRIRSTNSPTAGPTLRPPGDQLRRRPLQVGAVGGGHVLRLGDEPPPTVLARVAGHPPSTLEDLDGGRGRAHFDVFTRQAMWGRVEARVELDVVIDIDGGRLPTRELLWRCGQRLQRAPLELSAEAGQSLRYVRMLDSRENWVMGTRAQAQDQLAALAAAGIDPALFSVNSDLHRDMLPLLIA